MLTFTPPKTEAAQDRVRAAYDGPKFTDSLEVLLIFDEEGVAVTIEPIVVDPPSKLKGDIDNYAKLILDALNGTAWIDDRQVVKLTAVRL